MLEDLYGVPHLIVPSRTQVREKEVAQSCLTLRHPMDYRPRGSSVHGSFQARVLEWGAIAFSDSFNLLGK